MLLFCYNHHARKTSSKTIPVIWKFKIGRNCDVTMYSTVAVVKRVCMHVHVRLCGCSFVWADLCGSDPDLPDWLAKSLKSQLVDQNRDVVSAEFQDKPEMRLIIRYQHTLGGAAARLGWAGDTLNIKHRRVTFVTNTGSFSSSCTYLMFPFEHDLAGKHQSGSGLVLVSTQVDFSFCIAKKK